MNGYRIAFDQPAFLWLLAAIPWFVYYGGRHMVAIPPVRRSVAITLRSAVWILLVMAIAGAQWIRTDDRLTVMYVLDQSDSIPAAQRRAMLQYVIDNAAEHRRVDRRDQVGLVVFGREASIEIPPYEGDLPGLRRPESLTGPTDATNLQSALNLAAASLPENTARRIVIVTDGNQNVGDAVPGAARLADAGVGIDVVPIAVGGGNEVLVEKIDLPTNIRRGQPFEARVVINRLTNKPAVDGDVPPRPTRGRLRITQSVDGEDSLLVEQTVTLDPGKNVFPLRHTIDDPAAYVYTAEFVVDNDDDDAITQNNSVTAPVHVRGRGRVLVITASSTRDDYDPMIAALRQSDIEVVRQPTDRLFGSLAELQGYDAVILAGVPRVSEIDDGQLVSMSDQQIEMLVRNTGELGAGLLMIGGTESFGAGGWTGTKIEEAMPVDFQIKNEKVQAVGALALIMHASEIAEGNYWQKVIAKAAIEQLGPSDYAGLLHWTMGGDAWLWGGTNGLQPVGPNRRRMLASIGRMTPGDMPQFDPAMKMAAAGLIRLGDRVSVRHCVIVSDGDPTAPRPATIQTFADAGVTISTVAVASHGLTESRRLREIAAATGGKYYEAASGRALPRIFQREARRVSKPLVRDIPGGANPSVVFAHPVLDGIDRTLPPITGMVLTQTKDSSLPQVLIRSPQPDAAENSTVLAVWNYGLGRTAVLTTDAGARWATAWTGWDGYDKFYSQLVRWLMRPTGDTGNFSLATNVRDGLVEVIVNALTGDDRYLNFLEMGGSAIGPDLQPIPLEFEQTAPGRYVGRFDANLSGNYFVNVVTGGGRPSSDGDDGFQTVGSGGAAAMLSTGVTVPYSDEYRYRPSNIALMQQLVSMSDGQLTGPLTGQLSGPSSGPSSEALARPPSGGTDRNESSNDRMRGSDPLGHDAFRGGLAPARSIRDSWHWCAIAAVVTFLADVFVRRVNVYPTWLVRLMRTMVGGRRRGGAIESTTTRLDRLQKAKQTANQSQPTATTFRPSDSATESTLPPPPKEDREVAKRPSDESSKSYTERLLEAKRRSRRGDAG